MPAELVIRRYGSTQTSPTFDFTVMDSGGTTINQTADLFLGDVDSNYSIYLPAGDLRNWVTFNNRRSEAHVKVHHPVSTWTPAGFYPLLNIYVSNLFGLTTNYQTVYFQGRERLLRMEFTTNQVTEGGTNFLRLSRAVPQAWSPINTNNLDVSITVKGLASPGVDHDLASQSVIFPFNVRSVDIPIAALNDSETEGWESVYVQLTSLATNYRPDTRTGSNWMAAMNIGDPGLTNNTGPLDSDEDGMPDAWEAAYGLNPFVYNDPYADPDADGVPSLEEALNGSNPTVKDSDADGVDDAAEWTHGSDANDAGENTLGSDSDYVSVKFSTASCYKCHQTTLSAGKYSLTSVPPVRGKTVDATEREQIFQILKGAAYPVHVTGAVTADAEAKYTAQISAPTNATTQEFFLDDPDGMLGVELPVSNLAAKVATLLVPKVELTWEAKGDNLALDENPQTNATGQVMGKRIFVGAKSPSDGQWRDTVMLKIKVTPPMPGSNVWVTAFDVDDTTDDGFDNAGLIDTTGRLGNDNLYSSTPGIPNGRLFVDSLDPSITVTQDVNGEALLEFMVGAQPGNNYRVAATVFPNSSLPFLQTGTVGNFYVSAYTDKIIGGFNGGLSPLLTVWRKLHLEIDSMTAPPTSGSEANFRTGQIAAVKPNTPNAGQTTVFLASSAYGIAANELENGTFAVPGASTTNKIVANYNSQSTTAPPPYGTGSSTYQNSVIVQGTLSTNLVGAICTMRDDDGSLLSDYGLPALLPMDSRHAEICSVVRQPFIDAFIDVSDATAEGFNLTTTIPFRVNEAAAGIGFVSVFDDAKEESDSILFWKHLVTFGHEPGITADSDPDDEDSSTSGASVETAFGGSLGYSAVYTEAIRDGHWQDLTRQVPYSTNALRRKLWLDIYVVVAHETGHSPGGQIESTDHNEEGIMQKGAPNVWLHNVGDSGPLLLKSKFSPASIARFRKCKSWTD